MCFSYEKSVLRRVLTFVEEKPNTRVSVCNIVLERRMHITLFGSMSQFVPLCECISKVRVRDVRSSFRQKKWRLRAATPGDRFTD